MDLKLQTDIIRSEQLRNHSFKAGNCNLTQNIVAHVDYGLKGR